MSKVSSRVSSSIARALGFASLLALSVSVDIAPSAFAQAATTPAAEAPATPAQNQPPWQVACSSAGASEPLNCQMSQSLVAKQTGQRVLTSVVTKRAGGGGYSMTLGLPHGLSLPAGVTIWVDEGAKTPHPIETADQNGSYARIDLTPATLDSMRKGQVLNVSVTSVTKDAVILQLSLSGFAVAIDKI